MRGEDELERLFRRIDGRPYGAYRDFLGTWDLAPFSLRVDHVQSDPFASPSRIRIFCPRPPGELGRFSRVRDRRIAAEDFFARRFAVGLAGGLAGVSSPGRFGSGRSGEISISVPGQEVLERTGVRLSEEGIELRLRVGLPASGRRILGRDAARLFLERLPELVFGLFDLGPTDREALGSCADALEDARFVRRRLNESGLVAFLADGSVLPRRSGVDDRPLSDGTQVPLLAPSSLRTEFVLPHGGTVTGLGIPSGVTLIVGGGFHGKSCLLNAIEHGVYDHPPGDGRELVITDPTAVKIRAEDGRRVAGVNIQGFLKDLPGGRGTRFFSTDNASGSTSQAAAILESLEVGARVLLIDEDTAATNFMVRDRRMQELIRKEREPITPFLDRVRQLYDEWGISTILVVGGCGDYLEVADTVILLDEFRLVDATEKAKEIADRLTTGRKCEDEGEFGMPMPRVPIGSSVDPRRGRRAVDVSVRGRSSLRFGSETIDLGAMSQIVHEDQTRAIGLSLARMSREMKGRSLADLVREMGGRLEAEGGLDELTSFPHGDLAWFREIELAGALNRLRTFEVRE